MKCILAVMTFVGALCTAVSLFGETETRTFKLTYASAVEVAARLGAPAGAMNVVNGYPRGFNETNEHERESVK